MRTPFLRTILAVFCVLIFGACGPAPAATPQPAATPVPAAATPTVESTVESTVEPTAEPTVEPTAEPTIESAPTPASEMALPADWVTFHDEARGLVIHYPAGWDVIQPTPDKLAELIEQAQEGVASEAIETILRQLTETPGALDFFAAVGFLFDDPTVADNKFISNFTAIVIPADGLTLGTYADLVGMQLGGMEAVTLQSVQVESRLRPGGLDVASLRYALDGSILYNLPDGPPINGWQVALYDTSAERLLILSLTGVGENFPALEEMFRQLLYHVEFE